MSTEHEPAELAVLTKACADIREHWDTVQIFVTRHEPGQSNTQHAVYGFGNYFARTGHVREWLQREERQAISDIPTQTTTEEDE